MTIGALLNWLKGTPTPPTPPKFVSWYRAPFGSIEYLALEDIGIAAGYHYVRNIEQAHRFDTEEEAWKPTPRYDGSTGIETRAGVLTVRG